MTGPVERGMGKAIIELAEVLNAIKFPKGTKLKGGDKRGMLVTMPECKPFWLKMVGE